MYHPGHVLQVFAPSGKNVRSSDASTQALVTMWDENVQTVGVDPRLANEIQVGDTALIDYTQTNPRVVVKIVRGGEAKKLWDQYRKFFEAKILGGKNQKPQRSEENYIR